MVYRCSEWCATCIGTDWIIGMLFHISVCKVIILKKNGTFYFYLFRTYPGSEFVVANTLAKWKKVEPNEINFSQGFSQKVVSTSSFFLFSSLPTRGHFCCLLITIANSLNPDQARQNVGPEMDPNCFTP